MTINYRDTRLTASAMLLVSLAMVLPVHGAAIYVSNQGNDDGPGSQDRPLRTLHRAQEVVRKSGKLGKEPVAVYLRAGTYYLDHTIVFSPSDSATAECPVTYAAYDGENVVISGGKRLALDWKPYQDGILQAETPPGLEMDQLFVNGKRRFMARYPNRNPSATPGDVFDPNAFGPERAAGWHDPTGGYIHAMHPKLWSSLHCRITGKNAHNEIAYVGGTQNGGGSVGLHPEYRFVENLFEELDAPDEWYHDSKRNLLFYMPDKGLDVGTAVFEAAGLRHLVELRGSREAPVKHIRFANLVFRHTQRTFMDSMERLTRSDWTIYRGGGIVFEGTEDCTVADCEFDQPGGNAVFVSGYNRRFTLERCHIHGCGASGVCFVGDPNTVRSPCSQGQDSYTYETVDKTPGPKTEDYPGNCLVDDCLIHNVGTVEKQTAGVQVSMSSAITIRHCSIYDTSRAGINFSEGRFGGHVIEFCDVFDTVLETADHGSFNSWGRDRFWKLEGVPKGKLPELALLDTQKNTIRNSRWRCDRGWDVDLDDGSSNYEIYNNVFLGGGLKLREGFYRKVYNNIGVNCALHAHVWYEDSHDIVTGNIWMAPYARAIRMCRGKWGERVDGNLFMTDSQRLEYKDKDWDVNSLAGRPDFVDPANGDFRVKPGSPALEIGFKSFPMDHFGVKNPRLKALARTPAIPKLNYGIRETVHPFGDKWRRVTSNQTLQWKGALARGLTGMDFSAFGVSQKEGGVHLVKVPSGSKAAIAGFQVDDLILTIDGRTVYTAAELIDATKSAGGKQVTMKYLRPGKGVGTVAVAW